MLNVTRLLWSTWPISLGCLSCPKSPRHNTTSKIGHLFMVILRELFYNQASVIDGADFLAEAVPKGCCKMTTAHGSNKTIPRRRNDVPQSEGFGRVHSS